MKGINGSVGRAAIFAGLLCSAAGAAYGQALPPDATPQQSSGSADAAAAPAPSEAPPAPAADIVVTGSRISRKDYTADSPS